jgi:hypothetical protein
VEFRPTFLVRGDVNEYESDIHRFQAEGKTPIQSYEELAVSDIREADALLGPIFDRSAGVDGYASLALLANARTGRAIAVHRPHVDGLRLDDTGKAKAHNLEAADRSAG